MKEYSKMVGLVNGSLLRQQDMSRNHFNGARRKYGLVLTEEVYRPNS